MRIVLLASGISIHTVKWVNALANNNHSVWLISIKGQKNITGEISKRVNQIELKYSNYWGYYLNAYQLKCIIKKIRPDVINAHYASGYGTLLRFSGLSKKSILSVWGSDIYEFPYRNWICRKILCKNLLKAKHIAATSINMAKQVEMLVGRKDVSVTPFGVDTTVFNVKKRSYKKSRVCIGTVKTLEPIYRVDYLVESIVLLLDMFDPEESNNIYVKIYGEGSQKSTLETMIFRHNLENKIQLCGGIPHDEVPRVLEEMDIFVALSEKESFGVAILEACSAGIPVVVSDAEGFKEIVDDKENGYIVENGTPKMVAQVLHDLITDAKVREKVGRSARYNVEKKYSWKLSVEIMEDIYRKNSIMYEEKIDDN